ncbi:MAG: ABC transporter substrate-binding protein [Candidatus Methylomirabilales bacterium]
MSSIDRRTFLRLSGIGLCGLTACVGAEHRGTRPITVGASLNLTGPFHEEGERQGYGYALWAVEVNAAGGLLGRPIRLMVYDDGYEADQAADNYRRLLTQDRADLLLGPMGSIPTQGAVRVVEEAGVPCIMPMASNPRLWASGRRWALQLLPPAPTFMHATADLLHAAGVRRLAIQHGSALIDQDVARGMRARAEALGLTVLLFEGYAYGPQEWERQAEFIRRGVRAGAEAFANVRRTAEVDRAVELHRRAAPASLLHTWMEIDESEWFELPTAERQGMVGSGFWIPEIPYPGVRSFVEAFRRHFRGRFSAEGLTHALDHHPPAGYAAARLTQEAVEAVQGLHYDRIRDYLFALHTTTLFGPYRVGGNGAQVANRAVALQWQGESRAVVWPGSLRTAALRRPAKSSDVP